MTIRDPSDLGTVALKDELIDQGLGLGEAYSIALARELGIVFLANDRQAIVLARESSVQTRWFTEILQDGLEVGELSSVEEFIRLLDACIANGLYLSRSQRDRAVEKARQIER